MEVTVMSDFKEDFTEELKPEKSSSNSRITYPKEFLLSCFRNPITKKRPPGLAFNLEFTLAAPRITSDSPFAPVASFSQQPRIIPRGMGYHHDHGERYGNPNFHYHPPPPDRSNSKESRFIGMFFDKNPQQTGSGDIPKTAIPNFSPPGNAMATHDRSEYSYSAPSRSQSQDEIAKDMAASLRSLLLIGDKPMPSAPNPMPQFQGMPPIRNLNSAPNQMPQFHGMPPIRGLPSAPNPMPQFRGMPPIRNLNSAPNPMPQFHGMPPIRNLNSAPNPIPQFQGMPPIRNMRMMQPLDNMSAPSSQTQRCEDQSQNPNDDNQRDFKKIMDELVMKGTDKLMFNSK